MKNQKQCFRCKKWKSLSKFYRNKTSGYLSSYCDQCEKEIQHIYSNKNKEELNRKQRDKYPENKDKRRKYLWENREHIRKRNKAYNEKNRKNLSKKKKEYLIKNKDKIRIYKRNYVKNKKKIDSRFQLRTNISILVNQYLRRRLLSKRGKSTFDFLPYSVDDLIQHLEKGFKKGMTWDNYGKWHIDHIKADCRFNYKTLGDKEFQKSWALKNLQPLWAQENLSKNKY